jgi:hypothetical protein
MVDAIAQSSLFQDDIGTTEMYFEDINVSEGSDGSSQTVHHDETIVHGATVLATLRDQRIAERATNYSSIPRCCSGYNFTPQSGTVRALSTYSAPTDHKEHNIRFRDQMDHHILDIGSGSDDIHTLRDTDDADLNSFFCRPLKVKDFKWGTGTTLFEEFNPWELYFQNPRVINRIANFKLLRAKLHVKFVINGNGFHYGRALVSYLPLHTFQDFLTSGLIQQDAVIESQRPHIFLDPTTSTGGEFILPFFFPKSYMDIPAQDWQDMGVLTVRTLNALRHANGADDVSNISVFVWAEDVQLSGLTNVEPGAISPQSGSEIDQANIKGMVSGPASAVAEAAGKLNNVPGIGKYAKATQLGASTLAAVAKAFGYSKPPLTVAPTPFKSTPVSSLATVTTPDGSQKLTMDDKQELTIDPTTVGLSNVDEMAIVEIAKRESYLTTFSWDIGTPTETMLWNAIVTPAQFRTVPGPPTNYVLPACCYAVLPFKFWTGSMKFRFQIVASTFHKGRIRIAYDPTGTLGSEYNTMYSEIVDIADTQDFTITVTNNQAHDLLTYNSPCAQLESNVHGFGPIIAPNQGNGTIQVYVVNELTTPNLTTDANIEVNVFVSMGDDFEVFVPTNNIAPFHFLPQSGLETVPESQETEEPSAPFQSNFDHVGMTGDSSDRLTSVYVGESVKSFRQLAKRFNLWRAVPIAHSTGSGSSVMDLVHPAFPFLRGNNFTGPDGGYDYVNTIFLHWVRMPYVAWRGSIRYKAVNRTTATNRSGVYHVERVDAPLNFYDWDTRQFVSTIDPLAIAKEIVYLQSTAGPSMHSGGALAITNNVSGIEYEVPFHTRYRFNPNRKRAMDDASEYQNGARMQYTGSSDGFSRMDLFVAGGEDFSTFFWVGPPRLVCEPAGPPSGS